MGSLILLGMGVYVLLRLGVRRPQRLAFALAGSLLLLLIGFSRVYVRRPLADRRTRWLAGWCLLAGSVYQR